MDDAARGVRLSPAQRSEKSSSDRLARAPTDTITDCSIRRRTASILYAMPFLLLSGSASAGSYSRLPWPEPESSLPYPPPPLLDPLVKRRRLKVKTKR